MGFTQLLFIVVVLAVLLMAGQFLIQVLGLLVPLLVSAIVFVFILDKIQGGTAIDQLAKKIADWLKGVL